MRQGDDRYGSSGPLYNGGVAWDSSVSLMIDAGKGQDTYAFERSTGLGRADYALWELFIDEGGEDQYQARSGFGGSSIPPHPLTCARQKLSPLLMSGLSLFTDCD